MLIIAYTLYLITINCFLTFRSSDSSRARRSVEVRRKQQQHQQQRCRHLNNLNSNNTRPSYEVEAPANENGGGGCVVVTLADLCPRNTVVNSSGDAIQHKVCFEENFKMTSRKFKQFLTPLPSLLCMLTIQSV